MQRRPPVTSLVFRTPSDRDAISPKKTPIFPHAEEVPSSKTRLNRHPSDVPINNHIRNIASRDCILNSGGFQPYNFHPMGAMGFNSEEYHQSRMNTPLDCVTVAQHIESCPICSRLYDTDKTLYILAIIGLLILCFLMVKHIVKL
jgi:hypothetical protein